jgi:hypothetical protein
LVRWVAEVPALTKCLRLHKLLEPAVDVIS